MKIGELSNLVERVTGEPLASDSDVESWGYADGIAKRYDPPDEMSGTTREAYDRGYKRGEAQS